MLARSVNSQLEAALDARAKASDALFIPRAGEFAELCHRMADRFVDGGRLIAVGATPAARTDVSHVTVEFVHPVIMGKRALSALGLTGQKAPLEAEVATILDPRDILVAFGPPGGPVEAAVATALRRGCLTVAFDALGAESTFSVSSTDPVIRQELVEVAYHVLWELVHVFFEHRGLLGSQTERRDHDASATGFLYPFLTAAPTDLEAVLTDVTRSVQAKAEESQQLRVATLTQSEPALLAAAATMRGALAGGGRILTFGNGGSATDAADLAVDLMASGPDGPGHPALELSESPAILTALANDIGPESMLTRQLIAHGRDGDVVVVFSTSGTSQSIVDGLTEARRRGLASVAFVGYDGGIVARHRLADHVIVAPSQHIPRIQEAHATAAHLLCELIGAPGR